MVIRNKIAVTRKGDPSDSWQNQVEDVLENYGNGRAALLPCLETVQVAAGHIMPEAVHYLSAKLAIPVADIYSVTSFYGLLTTHQSGKYIVRVCNSLPCHINDSNHILQAVERMLGIKQGETTLDNLFTLEVVPCLGLCDQSPAMMVNEMVYSFLTEEKVQSLLNDLRENG